MKVSRNQVRKNPSTTPAPTQAEAGSLDKQQAFFLRESLAHAEMLRLHEAVHYLQGLAELHIGSTHGPAIDKIRFALIDAVWEIGTLKTRLERLAFGRES